MAIQLLMSAGRKTSDLSLMIISRSESKNSRTKLRFVLEEKTSRSCMFGRGMIAMLFDRRIGRYKYGPR